MTGRVTGRVAGRWRHAQGSRHKVGRWPCRSAPPPGLAYVAPSQAPSGAGLLQPGWGAGHGGEGVSVAASGLRHQALNWDPLSSSPGGFQLSLPLCGRGQGILEGERAFGNIRNGVSLFSPSILLTEFQSPSRLPASPDPSFVPALPRWRLW